MPETISATYKNGCLYPMQPLDLPDNKPVRIIILSDEQDTQKCEMIRMMVSAGLMKSPRTERASSQKDPVSEERRLEIAKKLGQNQTQLLSETIISERD